MTGPVCVCVYIQMYFKRPVKCAIILIKVTLQPQPLPSIATVKRACMYTCGVSVCHSLETIQTNQFNCEIVFQAVQFRFFNFEDFSVEEYEHYEVR